MNCIDTLLPDVKIIEPQLFGDQRGFFMETYRSEEYARVGIPGPFVQDNHSGSRQGILRGEEREAMELYVAENPEIHPVVAGTGGVRKARWGRKGRGKRGGLRVIYFYRSVADVVYFLDIYAKAEKEDLTPADKQQLKELVNRLRRVQ